MLDRRHFLGLSMGGFAAFAAQNNFGTILAQDAPKFPGTAKSVIVLWMDGGPSHIDTFDPKPGTKNGGEFKAIETSAKGVKFTEVLSKTARWAHKMSVVRSVKTDMPDHVRGGYLMHTGYGQSGMVVHPALGSLISFEKGGEKGIPGFVTVKSSLAFAFGRQAGPGFLGPDHAPFVIGNSLEPDKTLKKALDESVKTRLGLLDDFNKEFHKSHDGPNLDKRKTFLKTAKELKDSVFAKALDLRDEKSETIAAYIGGNEGDIQQLGYRGSTKQFGYGCLVARRLVQAGVKCVEVSLGGWDTHADNFNATRRLCGIVDPALAQLMKDLDERDLLDSTLILVMGEFGRTPVINGANGRDHWANGFSVALAGGGVGSGRLIGDTGKDGSKIEKDPVSVPNLMATICALCGINPEKRYLTHTTGLVTATDKGKPIKAVYE